MKYTSKQLTFNLTVTQILHVNDENDETVILEKPPANKIVRRPINLEVILNHSCVDVMTSREINNWLNGLYKGTLDINHKTHNMIADELAETITSELTIGRKSPVVSIKVLNGTYGAIFSYEQNDS
jgi:hypothetical protein